MFDISTYNQRRTKDELNKWLIDWATTIAKLDGLEKLLKRDRATKMMYEEAQGIVRYVNQYYKEQDVLVELRDGNQNFDGIIYDANGDIIEYVEITSVPQENDHKLRQELAEKGQYSLLTRLTHRPKYNNYVIMVANSIKKKQSKEYPIPTTLLVTLCPEMIVEEDETFDWVIKHLKPLITKGTFRRIVIFDLPGTHWHLF